MTPITSKGQIGEWGIGIGNKNGENSGLQWAPIQ